MRNDLGIGSMVGVFFSMGFFIYGLIVFFSDIKAHWEDHKKDMMQPWKLVTLSIGMSWLFYGALAYNIPDWDIGVSIIMAGITYLSASWCARAVVRKEWTKIAGVIVMYWFSVDGSYMLWHNIVGNQTFREANFTASTTLFWLCGFIWLPRGSLKEIISFRSVRL